MQEYKQYEDVKDELIKLIFIEDFYYNGSLTDLKGEIIEGIKTGKGDFSYFPFKNAAYYMSGKYVMPLAEFREQRINELLNEGIAQLAE